MHSRAQADSAFLGAGDHPLLSQKGKKVCSFAWANELQLVWWQIRETVISESWERKQVLMIDGVILYFSNTCQEECPVISKYKHVHNEECFVYSLDSSVCPPQQQLEELGEGYFWMLRNDNQDSMCLIEETQSMWIQILLNVEQG